MAFPKAVRLVEMSPRDGLQNEPGPVVATAIKAGLIDRLAECGLAHIEAASFVSPKWVPQMGDAAEVMASIRRRPDVRYSALTPNLKGFENALAAGVNEVAVFGAASESFTRKNINCSIAESLERFAPVLEAAGQHGIPVRGYVSTVLAVPTRGTLLRNRWRLPKRFTTWAAMRFPGRHHRRGHTAKSQADARSGCGPYSDAATAAHFHDTYARRWPISMRYWKRASV